MLAIQQKKTFNFSVHSSKQQHNIVLRTVYIINRANVKEEKVLFSIKNWKVK